MPEPVKVYLYDLSRGLASSLSVPLVGRQIDGIWHTSVVVYGREYYFGHGIIHIYPGTTHHGEPLRILDMGSTEVPKELFVEYIEQLKNVYTADKYHLLDNNCNTFTNEVCQFLTGKTIPDYITGLPQDFLNTPLGQQLRPLIDGFFRPGAQSSFIPSVSSADDQSQLTGVEPANTGLLTYPDSVSATETFVKDHVASVLYFSEAASPECQQFEPEFIHLIGQYSKIPGKTIEVAKIDIKQHTDIACVYSVRSPPVIKFYLKGEKINEITHSNSDQLSESLKTLYRLAYPPHGHLAQSLEAIEHLPISPIQYPTSTSAREISITNMIPTWTSRDSSSLAKLGSLESDANADAQEVAIAIDKLIDTALAKNSVGVKVLSDVVLQPHGLKGVLASKDRFFSIFKKDLWANESASFTSSLLHLAGNVLCSLQGAQSALLGTPRQLITELTVDSLLSEVAEVREAASYVLYNMSTWIGRDRRQAIELIDEPETLNLTDEDNESWLVELVSATVSAAQIESSSKDHQVIQNLVTALVHLTFLGEDTLTSLANILGLQTVLEEISKQVTNSKIKELLREFDSILDQKEG